MPDPIDDAQSPVFICPTCKQLWSGVSCPRVSLDDNTFIANGSVVALTATEAELLYLLVTRAPNVLRLDTIISSLWPRDEPNDPEGEVRVLVHKIRNKIASTHWSIDTVWGRGYRLMPIAEAT